MAENEQVEPTADEVEMMQQLREELKSLTVSDHLLFMMHSLSALAVDRMGLAEQAGGRRDLEEARLAIDSFKALFELVGNTRSTEEMAAHRSVLSQLQMSYVAVLGSGGAGEATPAEAAEESSEGPLETLADASTGETPEASPDETLADESPGEAPAKTPEEAAAEAPLEASGDARADEPADTREGQE